MTESLSTGNDHTNVEKQNAAIESPEPKVPLSPQLKIEPASEWANNTLSALDSSEQLHSAATPGPELPGGYPYTPSSLEPGPSFEEMRDTAKEYLYAAGQYVPSHEDVKKMAQNAGFTVRGYMPNGVAAYLGRFYWSVRAFVLISFRPSERFSGSCCNIAY